jgi:acetylornithine deacetylase
VPHATPSPAATREILARLVAFDTTSSEGNLEVVDWLADRLDRPGIEIERNLSPDGRKANLCVRIGPESGAEEGAGLVLSGHLDTVPANEPGWTSDPWELTDGDDRWVARGACDMKGFIALAVAQAAEIEPASLSSPLALLLTYDEEVGSLGAQRFVATAGERAPLPRRLVVGEPTSLEAVRLHKGHLWLRLEVEGKSAHSGTPQLGRNAVVAASRAVLALERLAAELAGEHPAQGEHFPEVPYVALNVGRFAGGRAVNVVPDRAQVDFGLRLLPGMEAQPFVDRVRETLRPVLEGDPWSAEVVNWSPPLLTPGGSPLVSEIQSLVDQTETRSVPFSSDAGTLVRLGHDCVLWGPGSISVAHRPNEWIAKAQLERAGELIGRLIARCCGREAA